MLWVWIGQFMVLVMRLFLTPPKGLKPAWIDRNEPCPACGGKKGNLEFTRVGPTKAPKVKHTCEICRFTWASEPISTPKEPLS